MKASIFKREKMVFLYLFAIAFLVTLNSTYSPVSFRRMHIDSSAYVTIAQGITRGQLPYRDFVDNKGPLLYLINAAGLKIGGFTGIWIVEFIFLFVSVLFAYKTALFFGDKLRALLGTIFSFVVLLAFYTVSAGTELYVLPFLMISLFIFTKYFLSSSGTISFGELVVLGGSFVCAIMIRLNVFPMWAGFCIVIFIESITRHRFALLGKYAVGFFAGIALAGIPVFLYLHLNGITGDFIQQVILAGSARGFDGGGIKETAKNFFVLTNRNLSILPLAVGLFLMMRNFRQNTFVYFFAYFLSYFLMILFFSFSSGDSHWNMVFVPFFVPALTFFAEIVHSALSAKKASFVLTAMVFCFVFSEGLLKYIDDLSEIFTNNSGTELIKTGRMIDENTVPGDRIISIGFNGYIYPFTQRDAASRFFFQGSGSDAVPGAREEFVSDILTTMPAVVAIFTAEDGDGKGQIMLDWHAPVLEMIESDYRVLSTDNGFTLYIRN